MKKLSSHQEKFLRGKAHHLDPVVMVGKNGVTESLIKMVNDALNSHELIKVRFVEFKDRKKELSRELTKNSKSEIVGMIGHIAILYRQHPDEDKRKIELPSK
ncbi:MAG: ribosome assembly RNA-binding protein YhbY [Deltaproteobacteria bacterium]|nr:ribosome assembly RNA-binding protein YhbY [Deltaproteobacteria bacterium]